MGLVNYISRYNTDVKIHIVLNNIKGELSDMNNIVEFFLKKKKEHGVNRMKATEKTIYWS